MKRSRPPICVSTGSYVPRRDVTAHKTGRFALKQLVVAALTAIVVVCAAALPAASQSATTVVIRRVDTSDFPQVRLSVLVEGAVPQVEDIVLRENGTVVPADRLRIVPLDQTDTEVGIVLAIDTSGSMRGDKLAQAKAAARRFVEQKAETDRIAVVAFSDEPRVVADLTTDEAALLAAIDSLEARGETALWAGLVNSARLFGGPGGAVGRDPAAVLPHIVVLSDGANTIPGTPPGAAVEHALSIGAPIFAVGLRGSGEFDAEGLRTVAAATGGRYEETARAEELAAIYDAVQRTVQSQYELVYTSTAEGPIDLRLSVGGVTVRAEAAPNTVAQGQAATPRVADGPPVPGFLEGSAGLLVASVLIGLAAVALLAAAVVYRKRSGNLDDVLAPYSGGGAVAAEEPAPSRERSFAQTAVVRRAVETTARFAGRSGALENLEARLDRADLRLRPQEALFFYLAGVAVLGLLAAAIAGPLIGLAGLVIGALIPVAVLDQLGDRRQRAFAQQLPDALQLLSGALRAGFSLVQALEVVSREIDDPMGRELRRAVLETELGRPLDEALEDTAGRMQSPDFDWVVIAIRIQREVGGNLAELFTTVAATIVSREQLRREVRSLTAEGRLSAIVMGALPLVLALGISALNPGYLSPLFSSNVGKMLILFAVVLAAAGFVWMKKVVEVDV